MALVKCETVRELKAALVSLPDDAPLATLYDWGEGKKYGVTVHGMHTHDDNCDSTNCSLPGHVVLDIDPRPLAVGVATGGGLPIGGTFVINAGDGSSDPIPFDATDERKQAAYEQAKSRASVADKSKFPDVPF
jgi:hypothetical protein